MTHYTIAIASPDGETSRILTSPSAVEVLGFLKHLDHGDSTLVLIVSARRGGVRDGREITDPTKIYEELDNAITKMGSDTATDTGSEPEHARIVKPHRAGQQAPRKRSA